MVAGMRENGGTERNGTEWNRTEQNRTEQNRTERNGMERPLPAGLSIGLVSPMSGVLTRFKPVKTGGGRGRSVLDARMAP
ncbi:hypothetical protein [Paenibacillus pinistramenti]|uniref:hypothetical protein n=1 Tax=Paenibacillus pinistramenti TaxID=1768003 RepID=UPI001108D896|nr:hypothetical protein [Paenibacillus pinistramenti]